MTTSAVLSAQHRFVVPGVTAGVSGGNLYNRELLAACERARASVATVDLDRAPELLRAADAGFFWLDTLYLENWRALHAVPRSASLGLLVHYLPSLVEHRGTIGRDLLTEDERLALDQADAFIVTSAWMCAAVRRLTGGQRQLLVVEPGRAERSPETPPAPAEGVRAVLVANLVAGKGVLPFLRALAAELTASDRFQLTIVGGSPVAEYAESCRAEVADEPLLSACVTFAGALGPDAVLSLVARSNLLISSSYFEAYGMALCEARLAGLPIVARAGGNAGAWAVLAAGGELCSADRDLARAVLRLCREPALHASRLERAQRARLPPRPWSRAADDFIAQAQHLAGSPRPSLDAMAHGTTSEMRARTMR